MNKLISTELNGFPFVLDDLRFVDDGIRDAFKGVHSFLLDETLVNDGFLYAKGTPHSPSLNANSSYRDAGSPIFPVTYCNINGEIYKIPATTLNFTGRVNGDTYCIEQDFSFDGDGTKVFEDTNTHDTYQIREAKLVLKVGSFVAGTDIPVLFFDDIFGNGISDRFIYDDEFTFLGRLATKLGVMDNEFIQSLQTSQISTINNTINEAWTTINPTTIPTKLYLNASVRPSDYLTSPDYLLGASPHSGTMDTANSYFKFKKTGKTLYVDFLFKNVILKNNDVWSGIGLISFDLNGVVPSLTSLRDFKSIATGNESNTGGGTRAFNGNNIEVSNHKFKPKFFTMNLQNPSQSTDNAYTDGAGVFNAIYNFSNNPPTPTSYLSGDFAWTFKGQFTCEIS